jgi:hypothetical protein
MSIELSTEREGRSGHVDEVVADGLYDEICGSRFHLDCVASLELGVSELKKAHDAFHKERDSLDELLGDVYSDGVNVSDKMTDKQKARLQTLSKDYAAALFEISMLFDTLATDEESRMA